jgi:hypothetical protein
MAINAKRKFDTIKAVVPVQFHEGDGTVTHGNFTANFRRIDQARIDEMLDANTPNSEVLEEVLDSVDDVFEGDARMTPADALAWVKKTPECVSAAVTSFFEKLRPAATASKTSKTRR